MITYTLPDFTVGLGLNLFFVRLIERYPERFQDGVRIGSVYGCFPGCIANGGRAYVCEPYSAKRIEETFSILDSYGLSARLTLTNMLLRPYHLEDPYFRAIMDASRGHSVEAIVCAPAMDDFIRSNFPEMPRILSTTREIVDIDELNQATEDFDLVVLNYQKHRDDGFLRRIRRPDKIEVMVNEFCHPGCPHRVEHYVCNSRDQLDGKIRPFKCVQPSTSAFFEHQEGHPVILTAEDVRRMHEEYGFENFKIVGRGVAFATVLESLVYYLVKPEYREWAKACVMEQMRRQA